jgi:hypothetical protein
MNELKKLNKAFLKDYKAEEQLLARIANQIKFNLNRKLEIFKLK